jgi:predicted GNAT family acetyltransferase
MSRNGGPSEIACIIVVGRDSGPVAAITKVFTHKDWRSKGCAERLVRHVCKEYISSPPSPLFSSNSCCPSPRLLSTTKEKVILFVAHDNTKANGVYHRVGFVGLKSAAGSVPLVGPWLEIGFDKEFVELGHW